MTNAADLLDRAIKAAEEANAGQRRVILLAEEAISQRDTLFERTARAEADLARLEAKYALAVQVCEEASALAHALGWDDDRYICQALDAWRKEHYSE
jgi:hypothetical protein